MCFEFRRKPPVSRRSIYSTALISHGSSCIRKSEYSSFCLYREQLLRFIDSLHGLRFDIDNHEVHGSTDWIRLRPQHRKGLTLLTR